MMTVNGELIPFGRLNFYCESTKRNYTGNKNKSVKTVFFWNLTLTTTLEGVLFA